MKLSSSTVVVRLLLYGAIFVGLNLLASKVFFRLDFTADQRYTLSKSTKDILQELEAPVTITAYFSSNLPPQLSTVSEDLQDLLAEYQSHSDGNVVYEFIDPTDEETQNEAQQLGIFPLDIQSREKDQIKVLRGFAGAVVKAGNQQEILPRLIQTSGMEYALSAAIKKITHTNKARIGLIQGHGEPGLEQLIQVQQELINLYEIDTLSFSDDPGKWAAYKTLVLLAPNQPIPPMHLAQLDDFLASGGRLFVGINAVGGDLQAQAPWDRINTGLETWLNDKGIMVEQAFVLDIQSAQINAQRRQGMFVINQPVNFYYFPILTNFLDHPVTEGLEEVLLQFASPITVINDDSLISVEVLATTSETSGKQPPPAFFNPDKQWTQADFAYGTQNVAVAIEGQIGGSGAAEAKMVVIADGDFPLNQNPQQPIPQNNVNLFVNSIDWLTDDTGLIQLRTKGVESRPLEKFIGEEEAGKRTAFKVIMFFLPLLIVIAFGILRGQRRKLAARRWKEETYQ